MSLVFTSPPCLLSITRKSHVLSPPPPAHRFLFFPRVTTFPTSISSLSSSFSFDSTSDPVPPPPLSGTPTDESPKPAPPLSADPDGSPATVSDEWGEKSEPEPESLSSYTKFADADPQNAEDADDWGGEEDVRSENVAAARVDIGDDEIDNEVLKRCLVDSIYGSDLGFRASAEVRAEVLELVNQLEAANPNPNPNEVTGLLDGNWVLLYTAFSELLPLLAVGATPLLKVERISQSIDTGNSAIDNLTTLSSPFFTFSFCASASFEVRSSSRIEVQFREGSFKPPEINSRISFPKNVDVFGQTINLYPVEHLLNPVREAAIAISRAISGLPALKVAIPGERTRSWLLTTYLDDDLRIGKGDGGLFVLAREGSPLLDL